MPDVKLGEYRHPWNSFEAFYPDHAKGRSKRLIDQKVSGLPFDDRQQIYCLLHAIGQRLMESLAEEKDGFITYRAIGYTDAQIASQKKKAIGRLAAVNDYMESVARAPLFSVPQDTYRSAWEYYELLRYRTQEELEKI